MLEFLTIWAVVLIAVIGAVGSYVFHFRNQRSDDSQRLNKTRELGMDKASGQYPLIDAGACIGCRTCVDACPEGDVLGIVLGKASVINGSRCIGHGQCAEACPVGAIKVGLGDITKRDDIPLLDEHNQTNRPGLWIAGELSGFALINNAVDQGSRVAKRIATIIKKSESDGVLDLLIVGAGPAGMSAALVAADNGLSCVILDQQGAGGTILQYPRRKLVMVQPVEIPRIGKLPNLEYSKEELLEIWEKLHTEGGLDIRVGVRVTGVKGEMGAFEVETSAGIFKACHVLLALGRRGTPRRLNAPGEDLPKVAYKLVDAEAYKGRRVLVVGGGDSAVEAAMGLVHQADTQVTISYRKDSFMRIKQRNSERISPLIEDGRLCFQSSTTVQSIDSDSVVLKGPSGLVTVPNDDVFILAGGIPPFSLLREAGIRFGGDQLPIGKLSG
ncbi:MAG: NAD(P)-binding domain-containing protein [bacterium]|nr:NAD(P)-binding domain-containing protein [bacterium]